ERWTKERSAHRVAVRRHTLGTAGAAGTLPRPQLLGARAGHARMAMGEAQRDAERASRIAGRRLDPEIFERSLALNASVAHAVQPPPARHTELLETGPFVRCPRHPEHHFFGDVLNRSREVELALRQRRFRLPRRPVEQRLKPWAGHGQTVNELEILEVEPDAAVVADVDDVIANGADVARLAVG